MVIVYACRKTDSVKSEAPVKTDNKLEQKFFESHPTSNALINGIKQFVKGENNKYNFLEKLTGQIGFPYWDKARIYKKPSLLGRGTSDSTYVSYIPFVRDSQFYVNASLIVRINPGDTSMSYLCDWQYAGLPYGVANTDSSADNLAMFFMYFSKLTLGQSKFRITDTLLFANKPRRNSTQKLVLTLQNTVQSSGKTSTFTIPEDCVLSTYCGDEDYCSSHGGCDYQNCSWGLCGYEIICFTTPDFGGGGTGGDPGSGGGSGGGSATGGGTTPPPCPPEGPTTGSRLTTNYNCLPGWVPIEPDDPPVEQPCSSTDRYSGSTATLQYILLEPTVLQFDPFDPNSITQPEQYFVVNGNNNSLNIGPIQTLPTIGGNMNGITTNTVMIIHTHPYGGQPSPSPADFFNLATFGNNFNLHYVIGFNGAKYAMVVNNYQQLQTFVANNPNAILTSGPNIGAFNNTTLIGDEWASIGMALYNQGYSTSDAYERAMAVIMKRAGVTMVKANAGSNIFKKIGIQQKIVNGVPQLDPNGDPLYENTDCL